MLFRATLQDNYPFRKVLNLIRKYEGKLFFKLKVTTVSIQ